MISAHQYPFILGLVLFIVTTPAAISNANAQGFGFGFANGWNAMGGSPSALINSPYNEHYGLGDSNLDINGYPRHRCEEPEYLEEPSYNNPYNPSPTAEQIAAEKAAYVLCLEGYIERARRDRDKIEDQIRDAQNAAMMAY